MPFGFLRRIILRRLYRTLWFRRAAVGTFQVSCLATVDRFVPLGFYSAAVLGVARVADRVVACEGAPAVRPMCAMSCAFDHKIWDGAAAAAFLGAVQQILERGELDGEAP